MPDEVGTKTTRSDAPDATVVEEEGDPAVEEEGSNEETEQGQLGSDDAKEEAGPPEDLKVVVSIKGGKATIGVQRPSSDPHIESFDDKNLSGLTDEMPSVIDRARARWEETPKHPAYEQPAPPARCRNRRGQGATQASNAEGGVEPEQAQTPRLF